MIRLEEVSTDCFTGLSLTVGPGEVCRLIASSTYAARVLIETMAGLLPPREGRVFLFDSDLYQCREAELLNLLARIGVVWDNGGLISNLKVRENIVLPLWYHRGLVEGGIEEEALRLFEAMGFTGEALVAYLGRLPGTLPLHEKRMIGLIRAILARPALMIYGSVLEGLAPEAAETIVRLGSDYQGGGEGRSALHIGADEESMKAVRADLTLRQKGRRFVRWES